MKLFLYNLLFLILIPFFVIRVIFKSIFDSDYRINFLQRFGILNKNLNFNSNNKIIWFHAVSLGEVIGSQRIVKALSKEANIFLTVSTPTGLRKAKEIFKKDNIEISYAPWDFYIFALTFINDIKPNLIVIFETEIWPSIINIVSKKDIPIILSNGRISKKSYNSYKRFNYLVNNSFNKLSLVLAQSDSHKSRFQALGVKKEAIQTSGSVKFDITASSSHYFPEIDSFTKNKYILAASTHKGEDKTVLAAYKTVLDSFPDIRLVIVPRHPERSAEVNNLAKKYSLQTSIETKQIDSNSQVLIVNSIGKLPYLYQSAEAAFVGGSLIPRGGHNIIEPAFLGCPFIIGPHMFNFESIADEFINSGSCKVATDEKSLSTEFINILSSNDNALSMIRSANDIIDRNKGSLEKQVSAIIQILKREAK